MCDAHPQARDRARWNTSNKRTNDTLMLRRPSYLSTKTGSRERLSSSLISLVCCVCRVCVSTYIVCQVPTLALDNKARNFMMHPSKLAAVSKSFLQMFLVLQVVLKHVEIFASFLHGGLSWLPIIVTRPRHFLNVQKLWVVRHPRVASSWLDKKKILLALGSGFGPYLMIRFPPERDTPLLSLLRFWKSGINYFYY